MTAVRRIALLAGFLAWTAAESAPAQPAPPTEPTRIIWSNASDPELARFQDTAATCRSESVARWPLPEPSARASRVDAQRQQQWLDCMKARGYEPREVSGP